MSTTTTTGTLTAGSSKTFNLAPGSALSLTLSPNVRVTITETPETVSGSGVGGNTTRVHEPQLAGTFAYGPYAMGGVVVVAVASNSGSSVAWTRKDTVVSTSSDGTALVSGDGNLYALSALSGVSPLREALDQAFGTVTFSRASGNASVVDCYGSLQFAISGESRYFGARRVENTIADTEGLSTGWTLGNTPTSTKTAVTTKSPNHGRASAWRIDRPSGNSNMLTLNSKSYRPGKWCLSAWVLTDGATAVTVRIERSSDSAGTSQAVTPAVGVWTRIAVTHDILNTTNYRGWISVVTSGAASFVMCDPQMEWVHAQSSPAPSDYVPRGVSTSVLPASTYSTEAGVDGVRYYDYLNPWTLASGIATRSQTLTYIDPANLLGIAVAAASATNQLWSSGTLSAAEWTKTSTVNATAADSTLLGKSSLWKIEQAAATQTHRVSQTWRGTAPAVNVLISASCYAKSADAACPIVYMAVRQLDGSTFKYAFFNLATGVVSNVTSGAEGWMFKEGDCWCLNIALQSGASGSSAPVLFVGVTQTAGSDSVAGTLGNGSYVGAVQMDSGLPTSYIGDTSSSAGLTRAAESLTAVSAGMPAIGWTVAGDFTCRYPTATALKPTWLYLLYSYNTAADRGGFGLRPGSFGGFSSGGESEIFFDFYPGISADNDNWDGIHIKTGQSTGVITAAPMETYRYQWSAGSSAVQPSGSNQSAVVGSIAATSAGNDMPRPFVNSWPSNPRTWTIGANGNGAAQRGEIYAKGLGWYPSARTATQMLAAA